MQILFYFCLLSNKVVSCVCVRACVYMQASVRVWVRVCVRVYVYVRVCLMRLIYFVLWSSMLPSH